MKVSSHIENWSLNLARPWPENVSPHLADKTLRSFGDDVLETKDIAARLGYINNTAGKYVAALDFFGLISKQGRGYQLSSAGKTLADSPSSLREPMWRNIIRVAYDHITSDKETAAKLSEATLNARLRCLQSFVNHYNVNVIDVQADAKNLAKIEALLEQWSFGRESSLPNKDSSL